MRLFYPYFFSPFHIKLFRDILIISCLAMVKSNIFIIGQSDVSFLFLSHRMVYIIPALIESIKCRIYYFHFTQWKLLKSDFTAFIYS